MKVELYATRRRFAFVTQSLTFGVVTLSGHTLDPLKSANNYTVPIDYIAMRRWPVAT